MVEKIQVENTLNGFPVDDTQALQSVNGEPTYKEFYPVNPPFGYVGIKVDSDGKETYTVIEPTMTPEEETILQHIKNDIVINIGVPLDILKKEDSMKLYLDEITRKVLKKFKKEVPKESEDKLMYYLVRDFLGYGKIDIVFHDPNIEDVSCNGVNTPLYVWHRVHESIQSNIIFKTAEELNYVVTRLVYRTGSQISIANPILEGTLPNGFRAHITLNEISKRGDTFTIRKYRDNPFTIVDLIQLGTVDPQIAAYLWILIEYQRSMIVSGAVASGKTSMLNAISMFIKPENKVITIEEVRELRLHENWIPMTTRPSYQQGIQEITLFDLLKSALRQRPDYIIIGEVRGEEAYTLFQSIAVGHGGLCSIHADSIDSVTKRLITRPMDIPPMMLPLMNTLIQIKRIAMNDHVVRRIDQISEIIKIDEKTQKPVFADRFRWDAETDTYIYSKPTTTEDSVFKLISRIYQVPVESLNSEMERREKILRWMVNIGVKSYEEVAKIIRNYYLTPDDVYQLARLEKK
jgi:archaeal flagellar protein FlaI